MKLIKIEVDRLPQSCGHCIFPYDEEGEIICPFEKDKHVDDYDFLNVRAGFCPLKLVIIPTENKMPPIYDDFKHMMDNRF